MVSLPDHLIFMLHNVKKKLMTLSEIIPIQETIYGKMPSIGFSGLLKRVANEQAPEIAFREEYRLE